MTRLPEQPDEWLDRRRRVQFSFEQPLFRLFGVEANML